MFLNIYLILNLLSNKLYLYTSSKHVSLLCALISITGDVKPNGEDQLTSLGVVKSLLCVATRAAAAARADERFVKKKRNTTYATCSTVVLCTLLLLNQQGLFGVH